MLSMSEDKKLDIVELIVYTVLYLPALYCLVKHGMHGVLGWFYIVMYCTIRLIAAGIKLNGDINGHVSTAGLIVDNIGLSPLLLGASGILHEARYMRNAITNSKLEWAAVMQYHVLVAASLAMIATGIASLVGTKPNPSTDMGLMKGGYAIFFIALILLALAVLFSLRRPVRYSNMTGDHAYRSGTLLINACLYSVPMTLLRAIYGAACLFGSGSSATDIDSSPFAKNVAADVCMSLIPPMLSAIVFVIAGIMTVPQSQYKKY